MYSAVCRGIEQSVAIITFTYTEVLLSS